MMVGLSGVKSSPIGVFHKKENGHVDLYRSCYSIGSACPSSLPTLTVVVWRVKDTTALSNCLILNEIFAIIYT